VGKDNRRKRSKRELLKTLGHLDNAGASLTVLSDLYGAKYPELHAGLKVAQEIVAHGYVLVARLEESI